MVVCDIRATVDARDEYLAEQENAAKKAKSRKESLTQFNHVYLGSPRKPVNIASLVQAHSTDEAFFDFQRKLKRCIQDLVSRQNDADRLETVVPIGRRDVEIYQTDEVSCFTSVLHLINELIGYRILPHTSRLRVEGVLAWGERTSPLLLPLLWRAST